MWSAGVPTWTVSCIKFLTTVTRKMAGMGSADMLSFHRPKLVWLVLCLTSLGFACFWVYLGVVDKVYSWVFRATIFLVAYSLAVPLSLSKSVWSQWIRR